MAQGAVKSRPSAAAGKTKVNRNSGITKKGKRTIAPKKAALKKTAQAQKAGSAQLVAGTEKRLAERAGHLELLAGGKRDKKKAEK